MAGIADTLLGWYQLYVEKPAAVDARLAGCPVLLYTPPPVDEKEAEEYQLRTTSGVIRLTMGGTEPMAAIIRKNAENAFQARITIGRTRNNDIVLDDPSVSRFHAWLEPADLGYLLCDAGSRNGSYVSGKRLVPKEPVTLSDEGTLKIGGVHLTYFSADSFKELLRKRSREPV